MSFPNLLPGYLHTVAAGVPGTAHQWDMDTRKFLRSWDTGCWETQCVRPINDDLVSHGSRLAPGHPPEIWDLPASRIENGVVSRYKKDTKVELWNTESDIRINHLSKSNVFIDFVTPDEEWITNLILGGTIDADGNTYVYGSPDTGIAPSDFKVSSSGVVSSGFTGAKGRVWTTPLTSDIAVFTNGAIDGTLSNYSPDGNLNWSIVLADTRNVTRACPCPDGTIWCGHSIKNSVSFFPRYELTFSRYGPAGLLATVSVVNLVTMPRPTQYAMTALLDNGMMASAGWFSLGQHFRSDSSGTVIWAYSTNTFTPAISRFPTIRALCCDETGRVFGLTGGSPPAGSGIPAGQVAAAEYDIDVPTWKGVYRERYKTGELWCIWAENGLVTVGGSCNAAYPEIVPNTQSDSSASAFSSISSSASSSSSSSTSSDNSSSSSSSVNSSSSSSSSP